MQNTDQRYPSCRTRFLYAPGETAKFDVTMSNRTKESVKGVHGSEGYLGDGRLRKYQKEPVEVAPGGKKTISAEWKTADVLGCEVRADLTDGTNLIATGAEYFNVCPAKEIQRIGIHIGANPDLFTWPGKDYLATIPQQVAILRQTYANIVEYFDWSPESIRRYYSSRRRMVQPVLAKQGGTANSRRRGTQTRSESPAIPDQPRQQSAG